MSKPDLTGARWRKSSYSNGAQACVELTALTDLTAVRDSKNPAGGTLILESAAWNALHSSIKSDRLATPCA